MDDPFAASIERHMLLRVFEVLAMPVSRAATPQLLPHVRTAESTVSQPLSRHGALSVARGGADDTTAERRADELMRTGHVANREGRTEERDAVCIYMLKTMQQNDRCSEHMPC